MTGLSLIAVVMHAPSSDIRFSEAQKLLNYGFSNFTHVSFGKKGDIIGHVNINKGIFSQIDAILENDASLFVEKSKSNQIIQNISFKDNIDAPIEQGTVIGELTYTLDNNVIKKINIVSSTSVKKLTLVNMTMNLYNNWFNLLR